MTLKELSKTTQFVKNFRKEYDFLRIGKNIRYDLDWFDVGSYSIIIRTGVCTIDKDIMTEFVNYFNENNLSWFIAVGLDELIFHVQ